MIERRESNAARPRPDDLPAAVALAPVLPRNAAPGVTMLDSRFKPDSGRIVHTICHRLFRANRHSLVEYLQLSLTHRDDPYALLELQKRLVREVLTLQENSKKDTADEDESLPDVYRALLRCVKIITDGLAWRSLGYDRGVIHELAWKNAPGFIGPSIETEIERAEEYLEALGATVLLNDLTNCLRYGDLTVVTDEGVSICEVKGGKGSRRSGKATKQRRRLQDILKFINRRERRVDGKRETLVRLETKPVDYNGVLQDLIADARKVGHKFARVSSALAVNVLFPDVLAKEDADFDNIVENPFKQSPRFLTFNSYEFFDLFTPNLPPFSIFPLPAEDRVSLMTGEIWLLTYINVGDAVRALRRCGLMVEIPTPRELEALPTALTPGEVREHEMLIPIKVSDGKQEIHLPMSELLLLGGELLDEDCWAAGVQELLSRPTDEAYGLYHDFADEASRWD